MADADPALLTTDRLVIRRLRPSDAASVAGYKNDPDIARHQEWPLPYPVDRVMADIVTDAARPWPCPGEGMNIAIEHDGDLIGDLYVAWDADGDTATIGYTLASAHHGRGYATEAVGALVDCLFADGITTVRASVDPANDASIGVLRRVGFRLESTGRIEVRGEWVDDATYALTPPE